MSDCFDLDRFVKAQSVVYPRALEEIKAGTKRSHWMWFIFPQIAGLGYSAMAQRYAISSLDEARAYLAHPILGKRYGECVTTLQGLSGTTAEIIFGDIDAVKLRSSLTLFAEASGEPVLWAAIDRWFAGTKDEATLRLIPTVQHN